MSKLPDKGKAIQVSRDESFLGKSVGTSGEAGATIGGRGNAKMPNKTGSRAPSPSGALPAAPGGGLGNAQPIELGKTRTEPQDVYVVTLAGTDPNGQDVTVQAEFSVPRGSEIGDLVADLKE